MGQSELHQAETDHDLDLWGRRVLRGLRNAFVLSLALWGLIALLLLLYLRPVAILDTSVVSIVPPGAVSFCLRYRSECEAAESASLPDTAFGAVDELNYAVNRAIEFADPKRTDEHGLNYWQVLADGQAGPCIDYVVTKRHRLIARGYPAGAFSIGILHIDGMRPDLFHAVLLARVGKDIYVLDSRSNELARLDEESGYEWVSHSSFGDLFDWLPGKPAHGEV